MQLWKTTTLVAATALAVPTMAQDGSEAAASRTPAKAQKFLASVPPESFSNRRVFAVRTGEISSPDVCRTVMAGSSSSWDGNRYVPEVKNLPLAIIWAEIEGRTLTTVHRGLLAHKAGLRTGDTIISIDGKPITSRNSFFFALSERAAAGGPAQILFARNGVNSSVAITPLVNVSWGTINVNLLPTPAQLVIDWSKVEQITATDQSPLFGIELKTPSEADSPLKALYFSVAATRDRVLAAAQYLQAACDRTKELGF